MEFDNMFLFPGFRTHLEAQGPTKPLQRSDQEHQLGGGSLPKLRGNGAIFFAIFFRVSKSRLDSIRRRWGKKLPGRAIESEETKTTASVPLLDLLSISLVLEVF